jgi:molybdenum cofactor cytidylyltransferase
VVTPAQPPIDMKASVVLALTHIAAHYAPTGVDAWLVAPADLPRLFPPVIAQVLAAYDPAHPTAVVPVHRGERGHPTLLPWTLARRVQELGADEGVNTLVERTSVREVACDSPGVLDDVDSPADYARMAAQCGGRPRGDETTAL